MLSLVSGEKLIFDVKPTSRASRRSSEPEILRIVDKVTCCHDSLSLFNALTPIRFAIRQTPGGNISAPSTLEFSDITLIREEGRENGQSCIPFDQSLGVSGIQQLLADYSQDVQKVRDEPK